MRFSPVALVVVSLFVVTACGGPRTTTVANVNVPDPAANHRLAISYAEARKEALLMHPSKLLWPNETILVAALRKAYPKYNFRVTRAAGKDILVHVENGILALSTNYNVAGDGEILAGVGPPCALTARDSTSVDRIFVVRADCLRHGAV